MNTASQSPQVSFLVDRRGKKTHAVVPIKDYERLIEDTYDLKVSEERQHETPVDYEEAKARIRSKRK